MRELDSDLDAEFIYRLLNSNKFVRYIGDRGVRNVEQAADFIETRYRQSYRDHGFGLYAVERKASSLQIGICGFVRREKLPYPDIGFAFLSQFEKQGYGFESAMAMMEYGRADLGMTRILAITTIDNKASERLLKKIGFRFDQLIERDDETLKLYSSEP
ncbi:MAG: GNAT family N-acetyltransferase [Pyrinomonadaceae bacterium]|nr:GNAT family N-acetyltransferase [Pyrinomonadaceae bacterium]MBP6213733.1 GNAT family N-acetyltransferase [Pyrinomonadaceae bacterium]